MAALPQEMYDTIYLLTFKAPKGIRYLDRTAEEHGYTIGHRVRPFLSAPGAVTLLSVDKESQRQYISTWCQEPGLTWIIPYLGGRSVDFCIRWLDSLGRKIRELISDVRRVIVPDGKAASSDAVDRVCGRARLLQMDAKVMFGSEQEVRVPWATT